MEVGLELWPDKKMTINILNVPKIPPAHTNFCWAASIEMVFHYKKRPRPSSEWFVQGRLLELKNRISNPDTDTMENSKDYYIQLFNDDILAKIGCTQYQGHFLPSEYIIDRINQKQPLILSAFDHMLLSNGSKHAFVISGFFYAPKNTFWVLALDPLNPTNGTLKSAWIYREIIKFSNIDRNYKNYPIDTITNFNDPDISNNQLISPLDFSEHLTNEYSPINLSNYLRPCTYISILKNLEQLLHDFFGVSVMDSNIYNLYSYRSVSYEHILNNQWTEDNQYRVLFLPVWENDKVLFELIFKELEDNIATLVGIREPVGVQNNTNTMVANGRIKFELNHQKPNYTIVCITPMNFLFYEIELENMLFWSPVNAYPLFDKTTIYDYSQMTSLIKQTLEKK